MLIGAISTRKQNVDARLPACYALLNRSSQWADFQRAKLSAVSSRQLFLVMDVSCMDALEVQNLRSDVQTTGACWGYLIVNKISWFVVFMV
jgi:hypothetical protein